MEFYGQIISLSQLKARRILYLMGLVVIITLFFQFLILPYGIALRFLFPYGENVLKDGAVLDVKDVAGQAFEIRISTSMENATVVADNLAKESDEIGEGVPLLKEESGSLHLEEGVLKYNQSSSGDQSDSVGRQKFIGNGSRETDSESGKSGEGSESVHLENFVMENNQSLSGDRSELMGSQMPFANDSESNLGPLHGDEGGYSVKESDSVSSEDETELPHDNFDAVRNHSTVMPNNIPPNSVVTVTTMNQMMASYLKSSSSMKPQRSSSQRDMEILDAKSKIMNAPVTQNTEDLYGPLFHNISMFMRSYELMERTLKVYVYREGERPIFHQPVLKGLYASEGWFMKLMEANKHFLVKDPKRAHLFYMPFSSRELENTLYIRNSYNRTNLVQFMKEYTNKIATKYPYWNRTQGMDHFLAACHDWALDETEHMENSIRALCNADITEGFKLGWDVSLPETFIRFPRNPLRDVGGKPPSERNILAFYSGNNHGYLRPLILKHFKDRNTDMKIYGPMPHGVAKKMSYIKHMKSSKYCLCPRGYEVNSPRIVEAIFYECVPVIISDNFVPPFLEVLNWDAFSVLVPEKDVPRLRQILVAISQERYLEMQLGVRKVQRHFLWHPGPLKYDLFHMTLHSVWFNRVFQTKPAMKVKIGSGSSP